MKFTTSLSPQPLLLLAAPLGEGIDRGEYGERWPADEAHKRHVPKQLLEASRRDEASLQHEADRHSDAPQTPIGRAYRASSPVDHPSEHLRRGSPRFDLVEGQASVRERVTHRVDRCLGLGRGAAEDHKIVNVLGVRLLDRNWRGRDVTQPRAHREPRPASHALVQELAPEERPGPTHWDHSKAGGDVLVATLPGPAAERPGEEALVYALEAEEFPQLQRQDEMIEGVLEIHGANVDGAGIAGKIHIRKRGPRAKFNLVWPREVGVAAPSVHHKAQRLVLLLHKKQSCSLDCWPEVNQLSPVQPSDEVTIDSGILEGGVKIRLPNSTRL